MTASGSKDTTAITIHPSPTPIRIDKFFNISNPVAIHILNFLSSEVHAVSLTCRRGAMIAGWQAAWKTAAIARFPQALRFASCPSEQRGREIPWKDYMKTQVRQGNKLLSQSPACASNVARRRLQIRSVSTPLHFVQSGHHIGIGMSNGEIHSCSLQEGVTQNLPRIFRGPIDFLTIQDNYLIGAARTVSNHIALFDLRINTQQRLLTYNDVDEATPFPIAVSNSRLFTATEVSRVSVWSLATGTILKSSDLNPEDQPITQIALGLERIIVRRSRGVLEVFNRRNVQTITRFQILDSPLHQLEISENIAFVADTNNTIRGYNVVSGDCVYAINEGLTTKILGITVWADRLITLSQLPGSGFLQARCWKVDNADLRSTETALRPTQMAEHNIIWPMNVRSERDKIAMKIYADVLIIQDQENALFATKRLFSKSSQPSTSHSGLITIAPDTGDVLLLTEESDFFPSGYDGYRSRFMKIQSFEMRKHNCFTHHKYTICISVTVIALTVIGLIVFLR